MPSPRVATSPAIDAVLTMCPGSFCAIMRGRNASSPWMTPQRFTPSTHCQSRCVAVSSPPQSATPALLQSTWTRPKASKARPARAWTEARSVTSVRTASASPPRDRIGPTTSAIPASSRSATTTRAPSRANASASARPMPEAPPVTTPTRPLSESTATPPLRSDAERSRARRPGRGSGGREPGAIGGGAKPQGARRACANRPAPGARGFIGPRAASPTRPVGGLPQVRGASMRRGRMPRQLPGRRSMAKEISIVHHADRRTDVVMPYAPGIVVRRGCLVFLSGVTAAAVYHSHPHRDEEFDLPATMEAQAVRAMENLKKTLEAAGCTLGDLVAATRYPTNVGEQDDMNRVWAQYLGDHLPTTTTVEVSRLATHARCKLEISAIAIVDDAVQMPRRRRATRKPSARKGRRR